MTFEEIKQQSKSDLQIDRSDLGHASAQTPILNHKYLMELFASKDYLLKLEYQYNILFKEKWLYYSGKASAQQYETNPFALKVLKSDLSIFFNADKELNDAEYKIKYVKAKIEFITKVIEELNRRSFHISNITKNNAFENGEF